MKILSQLLEGGLLRNQQTKVVKPRQMSQSFFPELLTESGERKPVFVVKFASKPSAKNDEAESIVAEKNSRNPQAESGEVKPAVGERGALKPTTKKDNAKSGVPDTFAYVWSSHLPLRGLLQKHQ